MDPLTLAGTFATLVGLLANFKAERSGADLSEFMDWLRVQHQESLALAISGNKALSLELSALLATNHDELVVRLAKLNDEIARVASQIEGFGGITKILANVPTLSAQAKSVLRQIALSDAKYVMEHKRLGNPSFIFTNGATGEVEVNEPKFLNEDLGALVVQNMLRVEFTSKGNRKYFATRGGVEYARSLDG